MFCCCNTHVAWRWLHPNDGGRCGRGWTKKNSFVGMPLIFISSDGVAWMLLVLMARAWGSNPTSQSVLKCRSSQVLFGWAAPPSSVILLLQLPSPIHRVVFHPCMFSNNSYSFPTSVPSQSPFLELVYSPAACIHPGLLWAYSYFTIPFTIPFHSHSIKSRCPPGNIPHTHSWDALKFP